MILATNWSKSVLRCVQVAVVTKVEVAAGQIQMVYYSFGMK